MTQYDTLIIGAGINGLSAGATLARRGQSVCILEQRSDVGGMSTLSKDGGPAMAHLLYNLNPIVLQELGIKSQITSLQSKPLPSVALCENGNHAILRHHVATRPDGRPHRDADAAKALLQRLETYGGLLRHLAETPPPVGMSGLTPRTIKRLMKLGAFGLGVKRLGKSGMRQFLQVLLSNAYDLILDEMPDGPLAGLLAADAVRGAAAGPRSPGTVFNLIYRMGHGGVVTVPEGGMDRMMAQIAAAVERAGCRIETNTTATRILIDKDAVTGVELADGTCLNASRVFVGSGPQAAVSLTGAAPHDIETTQRVRKARARGTAAKVNLQLKTTLKVPGLPEDLNSARLIHAPSADYVETAFNPTKYDRMSDNPVIEAVAMDRDGSHWLSCIVQYAPSDLAGGWTEVARERLLKTTLETLERVIPDLRQTVIGSQIISPDQIETETGAPGGHWHHGEMSLDQILTLRPTAGLSNYAMGPEGLYLCSASSHPGGDVMGLAGRNAALAALEAKT